MPSLKNRNDWSKFLKEKGLIGDGSSKDVKTRVQKDRTNRIAGAGGAFKSTYERDFYNGVLHPRLLSGELVAVLYEAHKLVVGARGNHLVYYTPDFVCVDASGRLIYYEVKGYWREAALARIRAAALIHWYVEFIAVTRPPKKADFEANGWQYESF